MRKRQAEIKAQKDQDVNKMTNTPTIEIKVNASF